MFTATQQVYEQEVVSWSVSFYDALLRDFSSTIFSNDLERFYFLFNLLKSTTFHAVLKRGRIPR